MPWSIVRWKISPFRLPGINLISIYYSNFYNGHIVKGTSVLIQKNIILALDSWIQLKQLKKLLIIIEGIVTFCVKNFEKSQSVDTCINIHINYKPMFVSILYLQQLIRQFQFSLPIDLLVGSFNFKYKESLRIHVYTSRKSQFQKNSIRHC